MQDEGLIEGKYQVIQKIKEGGMGAIYKVRHIHLDEIRVIKVMVSQIEQNADAKRRFFQEAKLATSLKHPNIAALYDFAEDRNGNFFMVMEFIEGVNLLEFLSTSGALPLGVALELSVQALSALGFLHSRGIVHRDVSPDNFMVTTGPRGELLVKLIDLGVAKQSSAEGGTVTGMFIGKLKYGSPEQYGQLERGQVIDGRSDLYSFGCVLYLMVTGRFPYEVESAHGYVMKHLAAPPLPFEETDPAGRVPERLRAVILKALEKDRERRFSSASELAEALVAIRSSWTETGAAGFVPLVPSAGTAAPASGLSDVQRLVAQAFGPTPSPTGVVAAGTPPDLSTERIPKSLQTRPATPIPGPPAQAERSVHETPPPLPVPRPQLQPKPKAGASKVPIFVGASLAVVVLGVGGLFLVRKREVAPTLAAATTPVAAPATGQPAPAPPSTVPPAAAPKGTVLLTAAPWGDLVSLENEATKEKVDVGGASTPLRLELDPGPYLARLSWKETPIEIRFQVRSGETTSAHGEAPGFSVEAVLERIGR